MESKQSYAHTMLKVADGKWVAPKQPPIKIACDQHFSGPIDQPLAFGVGAASIKKIVDISEKEGELVGVRCDEVTFIPHCHGTHTEGIGHISRDLITISKVIEGHEAELYPAVLVTVNSVTYTQGMDESYHCAQAGDAVITRQVLEAAVNRVVDQSVFAEHSAIIIRCDYESYLGTANNHFKNPPYYTEQAIQFLADKFSHHLTNLPSIDRESDGGKMVNHQAFFKIPKTKSANEIYNEHSQLAEEHQRTNTEMCFIAANIPDGGYFLRLQILNSWQLDAAPSAPLLYEPQVLDEQGVKSRLGF